MKVAVFRRDLLPLSQTFIRSQAAALTRWRPVLLGHRREHTGLPLDGLEVTIVEPPRHWATRLAWRLRFWLGLPQPAEVAALRNSGATVVHAHFATDATDLWPSVKSLRLPLVVTLHGYDINTEKSWWRAGAGGLRRRVYPRRLLAMASAPHVRFIAVSDAIARQARRFGIPADAIVVSSIGVDTQALVPSVSPPWERSSRVLFVGRMVEKKAPLRLIRAFAHVARRVPAAELVMVGDGPLLDAAKTLARELDVRAEFTGALSSEQVVAQFHRARVFCLPSTTASNGDAEGLPISILEAQALGVPVVTSARGAVEEGLDGGAAGIVVPEDDDAVLADALVSVLTDDARAAELSRRGRENVTSRFDLHRCTQALELIYDECVTSVAEAFA